MMKWLFFIAFGVVAYELIRAFAPEWERMTSGSQDLRRALNEGPGRMNITGSGRGATVSVDDSDGGHTQRVVGRGVVR
jgi:hypothetical protein